MRSTRTAALVAALAAAIAASTAASPLASAHSPTAVAQAAGRPAPILPVLLEAGHRWGAPRNLLAKRAGPSTVARTITIVDEILHGTGTWATAVYKPLLAGRLDGTVETAAVWVAPSRKAMAAWVLTPTGWLAASLLGQEILKGQAATAAATVAALSRLTKRPLAVAEGRPARPSLVVTAAMNAAAEGAWARWLVLLYGPWGRYGREIPVYGLPMYLSQPTPYGTPLTTAYQVAVWRAQDSIAVLPTRVGTLGPNESVNMPTWIGGSNTEPPTFALGDTLQVENLGVLHVTG